jgi:hypothetical protein
VTVEDVPQHDSCANAHSAGNGVHPATSDEAALFTNLGATDSDFTGSTFCVTESNSDVWFDYVATTTGRVAVSTMTPPGRAPGTLLDSVLAVFPACGAWNTLACNDDFGADLLSRLEFEAVHGVRYRIMVAGWGAHEKEEGTFWLTIEPQFRLEMSAPTGPGSLLVELKDGGDHLGFYSCLNVHQGTFPYGPFFGIQPTFTELLLQLTSGAEPFLGAMNSTGEYAFGPVVGLPSGVALFGVTLEFDATGAIVAVTPPTSFVIP